MPWPIGLRGRAELDEAVGVTLTVTALSKRVAAGPFEEGGDAAAAQPAARLRCSPRRAA
jgi:hypothetical protein